MKKKFTNSTYIIIILAYKMADLFVNKEHIYKLLIITVNLNYAVITKYKEVSNIINPPDAIVVKNHTRLAKMAYQACASYKNLLEAHARFINLHNEPCINTKVAINRALINALISEKSAITSEEMALRMISFNYTESVINHIFENIKVKVCKDAINARRYAKFASSASARANILHMLSNSDNFDNFDNEEIQDNKIYNDDELLEHYTIHKNKFYTELFYHKETISEEMISEDILLEEIISDEQEEEYFQDEYVQEEYVQEEDDYDKENIKMIIINEMTEQIKNRLSPPCA